MPKEDELGNKAMTDQGVRSFAVDYPNKFKKICAVYFAGQVMKNQSKKE